MATIPRIRNYFKPNSQVLKSDLPFWRAWQVMRSTGATVLPVVENDRVIGTISHEDLYNASRMGQSENRAVIHGMIPDPVFARVDDSLEDVVQKILEGRRPGAVVVDEDFQVLGIFSVYDAVNALYRMVKSTGFEKAYGQTSPVSMVRRR